MLLLSPTARYIDIIVVTAASLSLFCDCDYYDLWFVMIYDFLSSVFCVCEGRFLVIVEEKSNSWQTGSSPTQSQMPKYSCFRLSCRFFWGRSASNLHVRCFSLCVPPHLSVSRLHVSPGQQAGAVESRWGSCHGNEGMKCERRGESCVCMSRSEEQKRGEKKRGEAMLRLFSFC